MFDTTIDQIKALRDDSEVVIVKLGTVTELSGGKAKVKLYGDGAASNKLYQYIDGYIPAVNDKVALLPQGRTYIILGKITDAVPVEKYATKEYVDDLAEGLLPIEYKNKLEDGTETITFSGAALVPKTNNADDIGSSSYYFKDLYIKKLVLDGAEYTEFKQDRIEVKSGGTTYSLIATVASGYVTLTPSTNDRWKLGTKSYQLNEAWLGLFRGTWKSGQTTERAVSWNSSNALVPDSNNAIDLGTASNTFKQLFLNALIGAKYQYQSGSANNIGWNSATELAPNNTNVVNFGSSSKQFNSIYAKEFYINGTKLDIDGITLDKLTTKYGNTSYTLTLSVKQPGASSQYEELAPSVNNKFNLGSSSYKFQNVYSATFTGDLDGGLKDGTNVLSFNSTHDLVPSTTNVISIGNATYKLKNIYAGQYHGGWADASYDLTWDASHNIIPSSTNAVSLGTSSRQYKNVYGQNLYVNGTAVSSDRRLKEDIEPLDDKYIEFFENLQPVSYKFKDGTSGRKHTGFIAQEVEEAAEEAGLTDKDIAVVVKDQEENYYLRYEEIIAVQTKVIQDLMARVESLEARVNKLEAERSRP